MPPEAPNNEHSPDPRLESLHANARGYASALREAKQLATASQQHTDRMLTWAIGLMGAGLFTTPSLLRAACTEQGNRFQLLYTTVPWVLGILFAILARLVTKELQMADDMLSIQKTQAVETLLLRNEDFDITARKLLDIMNDKDARIGRTAAKANSLNWWTDLLYYATHVLLAVGVIVLFWVVTFC